MQQISITKIIPITITAIQVLYFVHTFLTFLIEDFSQNKQITIADVEYVSFYLRPHFPAYITLIYFPSDVVNKIKTYVFYTDYNWPL